jgi:hypothetical protein
MEIMYVPIEEINESNLFKLIENQIAENQYIDYKECPFESNKEFLYDISAFANAHGGMIIIGIAEESDSEGKNTGIPKTLKGTNENIDQLKLKYESLIRDGTQPRIIGIQMGAVTLENGNNIFIIKIPNSLNSPHMVTIQGSQRFYIRNSAGKHPMDISEIRTGFLSGSEQEKRIYSFVTERLAKVKMNQGSVKLLNSPHHIVAHVIPYSSLSTYSKINSNTLSSNIIHLPPIINTGGWYNRFNLNGLVTYVHFAKKTLPHGYVQLFRTGLIESVDNYILEQRDEKKLIFSTKVEKCLIESIHKYFIVIQNIGLAPPLLISIAFLGVKEYRLRVNPQFFFDSTYLIEEDDLILPEVVIQDFPKSIEELSTLLKPIFDGLWNAAGFPESLNYDKDGNWNPPQ